MQGINSRSSSPTQTASSAASHNSAAQTSAAPVASVPVPHLFDMQLDALVLKGKQNEEQTQTAKQREENASRLGEAKVGVANAKASTSTAHTDATEEAHPGAHRPGGRASLTSALEGLELDSDKGKKKAKATTGFSLGSGGAHRKAKKELTPEEQAAKKAKKAEAEKQEQFNQMETRVNDRMSRRVPGLPSPEHVEVHHDKIDGYALNSKHEVGGHKSEVYAKAGYRRINTWERGKPDTWREPAAADHAYQADRNALIVKLKTDVKFIHETRNPDPKVRKYHTKHTLLAPDADASHKPVVAKAAWQYDGEGEGPKVGRLTALVPSGYSTDEDLEKVAKVKAEKK